MGGGDSGGGEVGVRWEGVVIKIWWGESTEGESFSRWWWGGRGVGGGWANFGLVGKYCQEIPVWKTLPRDTYTYCDHRFPLQIIPQTTVQLYMLQDYPNVRIGFNTINKHHTLPAVYIILVCIRVSNIIVLLRVKRSIKLFCFSFKMSKFTLQLNQSI